MADTEFILEHEILKALYVGTSFHALGYTRGDGKTYITNKRDYTNAVLHFTTLVDMVNCPDKYKGDAFKAMQGLERAMEETNTKKYKYAEVSNAIEVLESNGQVIDKALKQTSTETGYRKIT